MRSPRLSLVCAAALAACAPSGPTAADRGAWNHAVELRRQGRFEDALRDFRSLAEHTRDAGLAAEARAEADRIDAALTSLRAAEARLKDLSRLAHPLLADDARDEIARLERRFADTPFAHRIGEAAERARRELASAFAARIEATRRTLEDTVERGDLHQALARLREFEGLYGESVRDDVEALLDRISREAERRAALLQSDFERQRAAAPAEAVRRLREGALKLRGTSVWPALSAWMAKALPRDESARPTPKSAGDG